MLVRTIIASLSYVIFIIRHCFLLIHKKLKLSHSGIFGFPLVKIDGNANSICCNNAALSHSSIFCNGENNRILCYGALYKTKIQVYGINNTIEIGEDVKLFNSQLIIRAESSLVKIGKGTSTGSLRLVCMGHQKKIIIGRRCMISENVEIWNTDGHRILDTNTQQVLNSSKSVYIGNHVWIGRNAVLLKGVSIGSESIIGINSVVTKDVPKGCIVVGNPARIIKDNVTWDSNYIME